jgi:hypothetical protein
MESLSGQALVVYKVIFDDIRYIKEKQWTITNYTILLYGAIVAFASGVTLSSEQKNIAIFATIVLCACGSVLLLSTQSDLMDARKRLDKIDQTIYTKKEKDTLGIEEETNAFDPIPAIRVGRGQTHPSGPLAEMC